MDLSDTLVVIADHRVTILQGLFGAGGLVLFILLVILVIVWRSFGKSREDVLSAQRRAGELEMRLSELAGQLKNFSESTAAREAHMARSLDDRLDNVARRLGDGLTQGSERTTKSLQHLYERLAVIDTAQQKITSLSDEMLSLKDILSNKQARGAYGQARMEAIIRDGLHSSAYQFQATLSNNNRPDCLVRLPENDQQIVIDSKFPLEAFNALKSATNDHEKLAAQRQLRRDVLQHVKDISSKYLIAGETHETAILFVPSESVYADLHEHFEDVIQKAHRLRVILASPNVLMLLVQTMQAIFKDARMREQASLIQTEVIMLLDDVGRLKTRIDQLKGHFQAANKDVQNLEISTGKIVRRGEKIEQMELTEEAENDLEKPALAGRDSPKLATG